MSDDEQTGEQDPAEGQPAQDVAALRARLAAAAEDGHRLSHDMATTERAAAEVHDQAARIHEQLPPHLLQQDPQDLLDHAERERAFAASEEREARGEG